MMAWEVIVNLTTTRATITNKSFNDLFCRYFADAK